jgi:GNAT superfamily N-acetyltransferase
VTPPVDVTAFDIRNARDDELDAVAEVMVAAYEEYIPPDATGEMLAYREDIGDVRSRRAHATLIVAAERARILGAVTYYPDASREGHAGWPRQWAAIRLLAVHPDARGRGAGGSRVVGLHTTEFMAVARSMYERMGFVRFPDFDFRPSPGLHVMAYRLDL